VREPASPSAWPAGSVRTAVVWDVLSGLLAEQDRDGRGLDVLDVGGGSGVFAVPLAAAGHRLTVVDPSPDSLAALSRRAAEHGLSQRVVARQGDVDELPALGLGTSFHLVLCHSVLEIVDDPERALSVVAACLRPGGHLSLLVANRCAAVLARALAGRSDEAVRCAADPAGRWGPSDAMRRRFDRAALAELVAGCGLELVQLHGVRVLADLVPASATESEPGAAEAFLQLERELSGREPFRDLATQLHVLARTT